MIIKSTRIYFEDGLRDGFLFIEDGKFAGLSERIDTTDYIDYGSERIIPGIFDTHNHGTCGYGLKDITDNERNQNLLGYLKGCASQGVTAIFPTAVHSLYSTIAAISKTTYDGAQIMGIHSEGPWLNRVGEKGIRTGWPEVNLETAKTLVRDSEGLLKLVALAPEIPGIDEIIEYFLEQGVTLAYAHSDCNYREAMAAFDKGLSVATHTGNVMTGLHHRDIGGLGAALTRDDVECEVICDGMHISLEMIQLYFKIKDISRFMMISDCTSFSGAVPGIYKGWNASMTLNVTEDGFVLSDTGRLCGSSQPVLFGIKNLVETLGMPMETVLQMSSLNACKKYGFADRKGSITVGKDADFVVISDDYTALATYVNGRLVYDRKTEGNIFNPRFFEEFSIK